MSQVTVIEHRLNVRFYERLFFRMSVESSRQIPRGAFGRPKDRRIVAALREAKKEVAKGAVQDGQEPVFGAFPDIEFVPRLDRVIHAWPLSFFDADDDIGPTLAPLAVMTTAPSAIPSPHELPRAAPL